MNIQLEQFMTLASVMTEREIIKEIQQKTEEYKLLQTQTAREELALSMQLFIMKIDIDKRGLLNAMKSLDEVGRITSQIKNINQQ